MARFIKLTAGIDNLPVFINIENIFFIWLNDSKGGTEIVSISGDDCHLHVKESPEEVMKKIGLDIPS